MPVSDLEILGRDDVLESFIVRKDYMYTSLFVGSYNLCFTLGRAIEK